MDLSAIERRLEEGEDLKVKYRYPVERSARGGTAQHCVRSDKLLDVSVELQRFYTNFRGETPIWLEEDEIIEIVPDDGRYEDFPYES